MMNKLTILIYNKHEFFTELMNFNKVQKLKTKKTDHFSLKKKKTIMTLPYQDQRRIQLSRAGCSCKISPNALSQTAIFKIKKPEIFTNMRLKNLCSEVIFFFKSFYLRIILP